MPVYQRFSENQLLPPTAIAQLIHEQHAAEYKAQEDRKAREAAATRRYMRENASRFNEYLGNQHVYSTNRGKFLEEAKVGFVSSAIYHVVKEASLVPLTSVDEASLKALCVEFVREQGAGSLLNRFRTQNVFLAEMGKICRRAYDRIIQRLNEDINFVEPSNYDDEKIFAKNRPIQQQPEPKSKVLKLDTEVVDDFYDDLAEMDSKETVSAIQDRSKEAIDQFLNDNLDNRLAIQDVINDTKEKVSHTREKLGLPEPTDKPEDPMKSSPSGGSSSGGDSSGGGSDTGGGDFGAPDSGSDDSGSEDSGDMGGDDSSSGDDSTSGDEGSKDDTNLKIDGKDADKQQDKDKEKKDDDKDKKEEDEQAKKEAMYIAPLQQMAIQRINEMKANKPKNTFHYIVESLTKAALKDRNMRERYMTENASINMSNIVHTATVLYGFLETLNTTQMVNESFMINYLKSITA